METDTGNDQQSQQNQVTAKAIEEPLKQEIPVI